MPFSTISEIRYSLPTTKSVELLILIVWPTTHVVGLLTLESTTLTLYLLPPRLSTTWIIAVFGTRSDLITDEAVELGDFELTDELKTVADEEEIAITVDEDEALELSTNDEEILDEDEGIVFLELELALKRVAAELFLLWL